MGEGAVQNRSSRPITLNVEVRRLELSTVTTGAVALVALLAGLAWPTIVDAAFGIAWTAGGLCALVGLLGARRSAAGEARATWTWLAAAALAWLLGQLAWDVFAVVGSPPSPNIADVGWWAFAVLVVIGVLQAPGRGRGARAVAYAEALPLVAAAMALTCALLWSHVADSALPLPARIGALVYPALYVSAAVATLQAIVAGSLRQAGGAGVRLVLFGAVIQAAGFILWGRQLLDGDYAIGQTLVDPLWVLGLLAIGVGGVAAARTPGRPAGEAELTDRGVVLPAATFALLIAALVRSQVSAEPLGARLALTFGLTICGLTLIARGVLLARGQRTLLAAEREARAALVEREALLERLTDQLAKDARRDPLTGLRNRRALAEDLTVVEQQTRRRESTYAVLLCDVDHFKAYNDALGHLAGDEALRTLAALVRGELRSGDMAYRYGGEELLIVLHDASVLDAVDVAQRLRHAVAGAALPHPAGIGGIVTISIGVAAGGQDAERLLLDADAALYSAKDGGRDRVAAAGADVVVAAPARPQPVDPGTTEPVVPRLLAAADAAPTGEGPVAILETLARIIRSELRFAVVVGNLRADDGASVSAAVVLGDPDVRDALLGTTTPWSDWELMLRPENERCGAVWLPAGTYEWGHDMTPWVPIASARPAADAWQPEDALLLPLRDAAGAVLAVIAVDEPLSGRRPDDEAIEVLMAVADHGAAILEAARAFTVNAR
jgi:diguanylate cyclase (GGDEF)-like protein